MSRFRTEVLLIHPVETVLTPGAPLKVGLGVPVTVRAEGDVPPTLVTVVVIAPVPPIVSVQATAAVAPAAAVAKAAERNGLRCPGGADGGTISSGARSLVWAMAGPVIDEASATSWAWRLPGIDGHPDARSVWRRRSPATACWQFTHVMRCRSHSRVR